MEHRDDLLRGIYSSLVAVFFLLWFVAYLRHRLQAAEGKGGWLASVAYGGGLVSAVLMRGQCLGAGVDRRGPARRAPRRRQDALHNRLGLLRGRRATHGGDGGGDRHRRPPPLDPPGVLCVAGLTLAAFAALLRRLPGVPNLVVAGAAVACAGAPAQRGEGARAGRDGGRACQKRRPAGEHRHRRPIRAYDASRDERRRLHGS